MKLLGKLFWPRGNKTLFMLSSVEHESLNAHKYKNIKKSAVLGFDKPKMPTIHFNVYEDNNFKLS